MRRRPLTPFGSHSIEKGIIHFRRGNADNPIRPTQSPADFQQRDGRGIASALEITQGRHGHATPFRRRLKRQIRRQTRRTNARTQRLQKFLPRLIDHNCSYKDRKRAYYTTTVFTKAIVRIMRICRSSRSEFDTLPATGGQRTRDREIRCLEFGGLWLSRPIDENGRHAAVRRAPHGMENRRQGRMEPRDPCRSCAPLVNLIPQRHPATDIPTPRSDPEIFPDNPIGKPSKSAARSEGRIRIFIGELYHNSCPERKNHRPMARAAGRRTSGQSSGWQHP